VKTDPFVLSVKYKDNPYPVYDYNFAKDAGTFDFDSAPFCADVENVQYDERDREMSLAVDAHFQAHRNDDDFGESIKRCIYRHPRVANNRLAFLAPNGDYVTERSPIDAKVKTMLYNLMGEELGMWEPKLLVNYCKSYTRLPSIVKNPRYEIDESLLPYRDIVARAFEKYLTQNLRDADAGDIELDAKKLTSIGFPFKTVDGEHISSEDVSFWSADDTALLAQKRNWLKPKKDWFSNPKGSPLILENQLSFTDDIGPHNIVDLAFRLNMVGVAGTNFRSNCPDAPNIQGIYNGQALSGKRRLYAQTYVSGFQCGTFLTDEFNEFLRMRMHLPFAANRLRWIYVMNTIMQVGGIVLARAFMQPVEKSATGFPSIKPSTKSLMLSFQESARSRGRKIYYWRQDRTNSEVSITTNFSKYMCLFPEYIQNYMRLCSTVVVPCIDGMRVQSDAFTSGVWYTTIGNSLIGMYTAAMTFVESWSGRLIVKDKVAAIEAILQSVFETHTQITLDNDVQVLPMLCTDDVVWVFCSPNDQKPNETWLADYGGKTMLNTEVLEEVTAFGIHADQYGVSVAPSSILSKLLFSEHPGFIPKDGLSICARVSLLTPPMRDIFDYVLKTNFGVGVEGYQRYVPMFWMAMRDAGLDITDVMNQFSPVETMIMASLTSSRNDPVLGRFVNEAPLTESARVEPEAVDVFLQLFKHLL